MILKNATIVLENEIIENGWIKIKNEKIIQINKGECFEEDAVDLNNNWLLPGFIDIHVHGGYGCNFESKDINQYYKFAQNLPKEGVTSYLFTTISMSHNELNNTLPLFKKFIENQKNDSAKCLGLTMEGPYINKIKKGAHEEKLLRNPNINEMKEYIKNSGNNIRMIIYAPELQNGEFTKFLLENNIIPSAGHTNLISNEFDKHYNDNVHHICHLYNAMNGIDHRNPGLVVGCLKQDNIMCEIISDGIHVDRDVIKMTYKTIGPKNICIITDATSAKGLADGDYKLGNLDIIKKEYSIRLKQNNVLAGSAATYDHNFRFMFNSLKGLANMNDLIKMSSINVAKEFGWYKQIGSIEIGKQADLIVLDKNNLNVLITYVNGKKVYGK